MSNASGLTVSASTMPTGLPAAHVELTPPPAAGAESKVPPGVKLFTETPPGGDARPAGTTTTVTPGPGLATDPGPAPAAAAPGDGTVVPPIVPETPGAAPAVDPDLAIAEAASAKAIARARAGAARKRQQAESLRQVESERQARLQAEQRARQAEFSVQDMTRIREMARSPNLNDRIQAAAALGISLQELGDAYVQASTPEGRVQQELERVRAEQARDRQVLTDLQRSIQQQAQIADMTRRQQAFVEEAQAVRTAKGATEPAPIYPELAGMAPAFVVTLAQDLIARAKQAHVRDGRTAQEAERIVSGVSNHELLSFLNQENASHRKAGKSSTPVAQQRTNQAPAGATGNASQPTPRTAVTNADKDEAIRGPIDPDSLTDSEWRKQMAKALRGKLVRHSEE